MGEFCNCMYCCQFYFFVDGGCVNVQCVMEDEWEVQDVVYLVWIVRMIGVNDGIWMYFFCQWWQNFWFWVCQCQDYWCMSYFFYYFLGQYFWVGIVQENICVFNYIIEGMFVVIYYCICGFGFCYVWFMVLIDNVF